MIRMMDNNFGRVIYKLKFRNNICVINYKTIANLSEIYTKYNNNGILFNLIASRSKVCF